MAKKLEKYCQGYRKYLIINAYKDEGIDCGFPARYVSVELLRIVTDDCRGFSLLYNMNVKQKVGLRIRELRELAEMSQSELSDISGVDRSYIASVENGQRNISIQNIEKIAKGFNLNLQQFFTYDEFN